MNPSRQNPDAPPTHDAHQGRTVMGAMSHGEQAFTLCILAANLAFGSWLMSRADFSQVMPNGTQQPHATEATMDLHAPLLALEARRP